VHAAALALTGPILQIPPMVSAVKVGGRRLHELARAGEVVERAPRPVTVHRFAVRAVPGQPGVYRAEVDCSSGTYVRTLADDLGHALGGGAHLRNLRRTAIGSFTLDEAFDLREITVVPPAVAMRDYAPVRVDAERALAVSQGKVLSLDQLGVSGDGPWAVQDGDGALLAVYEPHREGTAKPSVVVAPAGGG